MCTVVYCNTCHVLFLVCYVLFRVFERVFSDISLYVMLSAFHSFLLVSGLCTSSFKCTFWCGVRPSSTIVVRYIPVVLCILWFSF